MLETGEKNLYNIYYPKGKTRLPKIEPKGEKLLTLVRRAKFKRLVYLPLRTFKGTSRLFWLGRSVSLAKAELSELPIFFANDFGGSLLPECFIMLSCAKVRKRRLSQCSPAPKCKSEVQKRSLRVRNRLIHRLSTGLSTGRRDICPLLCESAAAIVSTYYQRKTQKMGFRPYGTSAPCQ